MAQFLTFGCRLPLSATHDDLAALIREVKQALEVPIAGVITDGQLSIRAAVAEALPEVPVWSKNSCGFTFVVFEEASKPFATPNRACMFCILADTKERAGHFPFP